MPESIHNCRAIERFEPVAESESPEWFLEFVGFHKQVCGEGGTGEPRDSAAGIGRLAG
jgi:hypothetical protein